MVRVFSTRMVPVRQIGRVGAIHRRERVLDAALATRQRPRMLDDLAVTPI
jgi:hypothetical protein